jgi:argininosuccinate lyase
MPFDPEYVSRVLNDNFEDAKTLFLSPLMAIHYAHLVMLAERGIVDRPTARALREALDSIQVERIRQTPFDGSCEDLFSHLDRLLTARCGADVAGRLHTARSRNDIDMTMYRLRQRECIEGVVDAVVTLRTTLVDVASRHGTTIFAAHTHTQPAQPTTLAHYLLAVVEQLERDTTRLRASHATTNRCPLGACAITGTGFPIDRELTSDLLGFEGPTGNTYGSIATVDYLLESASAVAVMAAGLGRFAQDLLLWCTVECGYLHLADGFVQGSTIMPQKRNPVALEHARAIGSKAMGQAAAVMTVVHNTPFGDIVDTEDDLQPLVAAMFRDAERAAVLLAASLATARFDAARMESRAGAGGTTSTELADHLVRERGVPFGAAHLVARRCMLSEPGRQPDAATLRAVSAEVLGAPVEMTDADLVQVLSPRHFVEVRRTWGGPAPDETTRAIGQAAAALDADREWLARTRARSASSHDRLRARSRAL